jgi:hypothetical protein
MVAGLRGRCKIRVSLKVPFLPADKFTAILGGLVGEDRTTPRIEQLIDKGFITMIASQILDTIGLGKSDFLPVTRERRYSMLLSDSSEYKEGEAAFGRGLTIRNNPYPFLSPKYWRWNEGLLGNCRSKEW